MREEQKMILRNYKPEDSEIICQWIKSEEELYKWSADRINIFPLHGSDLENNYAPHIRTGRFFPLTAVDEDGRPLGHFFIRFPREDDDSTVRFGFVIVDPEFRGKGCGKEMLRLGINYVRDNLHAKRIDLGVFENNPSAKHCYESLGFREYSRRKTVLPSGVWECADMELFLTNE